MSKCPYTWVKSFFPKSKVSKTQASELRVKVTKAGICTLDVALPARSARWLIDLIPGDVLEKIKGENIPIEEMQKDLLNREHLIPEQIFDLVEESRRVQIWLE